MSLLDVEVIYNMNNMEYIRTAYNVPAKRGMRVEYQPEHKKAWQGKIIYAEKGYLRIRRDGDTKTYPAPFHPTWNLKYLSI
jgi:hypothetical protein